MASSIPWKFILTKVGIPLTDVVTDTKTGYDYIEKGEKLWGASILSAMVCPLILVLIHELVRYVYRIRHNYSHNDPVNPQWTRLKILSQIPFFGQLLHVYFAHRIKVENQIMNDSLKTYRDIIHQIKTRGKNDFEIEGQICTVPQIATILKICSEEFMKAREQ